MVHQAHSHTLIIIVTGIYFQRGDVAARSLGTPIELMVF